jgi:hypothetical protein
MDRREATALLTAIAGGSLVTLPTWASGCREAPEQETYTFFTQEEMPLLLQVAETILPATPDSPGAKAAGIGSFMDRYVNDCLEESTQEIIRNGLQLLDQTAREQEGQPFLELPPEKQHELLVGLDLEAENGNTGASAHYFTLIKGLTLLGYFTSEAGATQALRYLPVPGKYEGQIPYRDGDKAWAL